VTSDPLSAVFLDVDGVLLDSLPQHLQICADKAREYGLHNLRIPGADEFRKMVSSGVKVSPMLNFFLAVGFPPQLAQRGVADYEREFMRHYRPKLFTGVESMLSQLYDAGMILGLVTSNTRANVEPALGKAIQYFDQRCLFYFDRYLAPKSKAWCLSEGARLLHISASQCIYVGDQPADLAAAKDAGCRFLAVTYGWGVWGKNLAFRAVDSVAEISEALDGENLAKV